MVLSYGTYLWWLYVRARLRAPELLNSAGPSTLVQLPPNLFDSGIGAAYLEI